MSPGATPFYRRNIYVVLSFDGAGIGAPMTTSGWGSKTRAPEAGWPCKRAPGFSLAPMPARLITIGAVEEPLPSRQVRFGDDGTPRQRAGTDRRSSTSLTGRDLATGGGLLSSPAHTAALAAGRAHRCILEVHPCRPALYKPRFVAAA